MKKILAIAATAAALSMVGTAQAQLILTSVMDGNMTGGTPKMIEIKNVSGSTINFATTDYFVGIIQNANTNFSGNVSLNTLTGGGSLANGEFIVIYNSTNGTFVSLYPSIPSNVQAFVSNTVANGNGDDRYAISTTTSVANAIDIFGNIPVQSNFYVDSIARRIGNGNFTTVTAQAAWQFTTLLSGDASDHTTKAPLGVNSSLPVELDSFIVE